MKSVMKRWALLVALVVMSFAGGYAQEPSQVENTVDAIVKKYDGIDKVQCVKVAKGSGLKLLKMMLKREFGKEFMQGVTSITIINYSEASQETCQAIRQELDVFASCKCGRLVVFYNNIFYFFFQIVYTKFFSQRCTQAFNRLVCCFCNIWRTQTLCGFKHNRMFGCIMLLEIRIQIIAPQFIEVRVSTVKEWVEYGENVSHDLS